LIELACPHCVEVIKKSINNKDGITGKKRGHTGKTLHQCTCFNCEWTVPLQLFHDSTMNSKVDAESFDNQFRSDLFPNETLLLRTKVVTVIMRVYPLLALFFYNKVS
jgi:hypothetical protein